MNTTSLKKRIMRRVYYAFALNMIATPGVIQGFAMLVVLISMTYFVSLGNVLQNMTHVGASNLGTFLYHAVRNTEAWTLLLIGLFVYTALSFRFKVTTTQSVHAFAKI